MPLHWKASPLPLTDPLAALQVVAQSDRDYILLHSGPAHGFSVLAFDPLITLLVDSRGTPSLADPAGLLPEDLLRCGPSIPPFDMLQRVVACVDFVPPHPLIGWLGFLSYDIGRFLEQIPEHAPDDLHWPLLSFSLFKNYLLFDAASGTATSYTFGDLPADTSARFDFSQRLAPTPIPPATLIARQSPADFHAKVRRTKDYIAAGDIYQANLAQRWTFQTAARPHDVFCRLCEISPAPYSACLRFQGGKAGDGSTVRHVVSASPELFLSIQDGRVLTRPIKGTRPRDLIDASRDLALREELLHSPKDQAELTMIVDLLRNDLGRISRYGTVRVADPRALEQHPTVWHTVATIESQLREDASLAQILAAVCPGGSITGAPKIRAMQIIEELEGFSSLDNSQGAPGFRRALYCGNIGVIGPGGGRGGRGGAATSLAFNIAIRTILFQNNHAHLYAGGGIVADSDPAHEYDETLHKAAALFRALNCNDPTER